MSSPFKNLSSPANTPFSLKPLVPRPSPSLPMPSGPGANTLGGATLAATLASEHTAPHDASPAEHAPHDTALAATLAHDQLGDTMSATLVAVDEHVGASLSEPAGAESAGAGLATRARTTVLPRASGEQAPSMAAHERYTDLGTLGEGAMGAVSLVRDEDIGREVAIKRLHRNVQANSGSILRFADEVRLVGQLEHPNIAPIYDVGLDPDGRYYYVMKRLKGDTLEDVIKQLDAGDRRAHSRFTIEERVRIFIELLHAMEFAHAQGIIHRDIKPANIMIGRYGEVSVLDWGLAKTIGGSEREREAALDGDPAPASDASPHASQRLYETQHGALLGTPAYMSPEQASGDTDAIGPASDIYALCAVFFEFLCLRHYLGTKETLNAMLFGITNDDPPHAAFHTHPHQRRVPSELSHFIVKGLQKSPKDRFESVTAMVQRLQALQRGDIPVQCPATLVKRSTHKMLSLVDMHPYLSLVVMGAALVLVVLGVVGVASMVT